MKVDAINRRARQRYASFVTALEMVRTALDEVNALVLKVESRPSSTRWTVASRSELQGMRRQAIEELDRLRTKTQRYEAELISREWRL